MKTLKLSTLAACLLLLVSSCTRDTDSLTSASSASLVSVQGNGRNPNGEEVGSGPTENPGNVQSQNQGGPPQYLLGINTVLDPLSANLWQQVTVTGTIKSPIVLTDGTIAIQRAAELTASKQVISYVTAAQADADPNDQFDWVDYHTGLVSSAVYVNTSTETQASHTYSISRTFQADVVGSFGFRTQFRPTQGAGVHQGKSPNVDLEVKGCTTVRGLTFNVIGQPMPVGEGWYEFTVEYVVNTCNNINNAKLQGGLTAVNSTVTTLPDYTDIKQTKNDNFVITWEGQTVTPGKKYQITFRKLLRGDGPWQITGDWSLKGIDAVTGEVVDLEEDVNYWQ